MSSVHPFVVYSSCSEAIVPDPEWATLYASLQALKGHVQEYPGCQRFDVFFRAEPNAVRVHCYTTWDTLEQVEVYLDRGYTFERMLADVSDDIRLERSMVMEKAF
jgi:hypothetical protein